MLTEMRMVKPFLRLHLGRGMALGRATAGRVYFVFLLS